MRRSEMYKAFHKLTGMESSEGVRYFKTKAGAARRADKLLAENPDFFFHVDKVDLGWESADIHYVVYVDHASLPGFNNSASPSFRPCV